MIFCLTRDGISLEPMSPMIITQSTLGQSKPQCGACGGPGVSCSENIMGTLENAQKGSQTVGLANRVESVGTTGQEFVGVSLVTDIPDDLVFRRFKDAVKGDRQLDGSQVR